MIEFTPVKVQDKQWADEILSTCDFYTCESAFGNIFAYNAVMTVEVAEVGGCFLSKWHTPDRILYCYPLGNGDKRAAIDYILSDGEKHSEPFSLFGLSSEAAEEITALYPGRFELYLHRDSFDYIYSSEDLMSLTGKKYQPKRNHISFFEKNNNWLYESITPENIPECLAMSERWLETSPHEDKEPLIKELEIIKKSFENFTALGYVGGLLRVDGVVIAYTMGERMTKDMFCVHIEKAYHYIRGAYPMINREFVRRELSGYKYIDREDDVGEENLRKAKLSYHPVMLPEKYEARLK